ncbi:hypothetical protein Golomagni_05485 [Golovinomyces magnicellulatus]|nr:hypothetical protein Golomagni_05485 [Golovinomyces magnicellulatus]
MYIRLTSALSSLALVLNLQPIFSSPVAQYEDENQLRIPTPHESAILARRILRLTTLGTFSTVFQKNLNESSISDQFSSEAQQIVKHVPQGIENTPIGLIEYIADCESSGNPTVLSITVATTFKNIAAGSNVSLSLSWTPPNAPSHKFLSKSQQLEYSAANLPRFSLSGHMESIDIDDVKRLSIDECFLKAHPDARFWLPGNKIHKSEWKRFVVQNIYWIGGFGDRAYIGWIPIDMWESVQEQDIDRAHLPGEKRKLKEFLIDWL